MKKLFVFFLAVLLCPLFAQDPQFIIPKMKKAPVLDGIFSPGEWDQAALLTMFGLYNRGYMPTEQPKFYVAWDDQYLYVALDSPENAANSLVSNTTRNDMRGIVGDDSIEMMFAAGTGKDLTDMDFPTYYIAMNTIGAIWDAKIKPQRNECHNTWQSGLEVASAEHGIRWILECRIPIKSIYLGKIREGMKWRANFCRTFYSYNWVAFNPMGPLNDARIGADMIFGDKNTPFARLRSAEGFISGVPNVELELVNPTDKEVTLHAELTADCRESEGAKEKQRYEKKMSIKLKPGEKRGVSLGSASYKLSWFNEVLVQVTDQNGNILLKVPRKVKMPLMRLPRQNAPAVAAVSLNTVYYHSLDKLQIHFSIKKWLERVGLESGTFQAEINITEKKNKIKPIVEKFDQFNKDDGTWTMSTKDLPEGDYDIAINIYSKGKIVQKAADWFEKRNFAWMKKSIIPNTVPEPYEPVKANGNTLTVWGRQYRFAANGFPVDLITQKRDYVSGEPVLYLTRNGKEFPLKVSSPFKFTEVTPRKATGKAVLKGDGLTFEVISETEYDGFIRYNVVCKSGWFAKDVDRLRLKMPLNGKYIKFLSASGDSSGVNIPAKVIPAGDGRIYDSMTDTRSVVMTPSFASLLWFGDHNVCFCYAADSDKDWILRKDKPAVEAWRKGDLVDLYINLIDKPAKLEKTHTMEFAFQTGPTKPRPANWREYHAILGAPDVPKYRVQIGGDGFTTNGGTHSLHPGSTPELRKKSKERIESYEKRAEPGKVFVSGYQFWGHTVKGFPEARVFRSEWGLNADGWANYGVFDGHKWRTKTYGENREYYYRIPVSPCPSYVDFLTYAYDETMKVANIYGFYDDVGYPKPGFNPELGMGYVKDGVEYYSAGLWLYRKRWQEAAEINAKNKRLNLLGDTQHLNAHYMPAYAFIGVFAPCEQGYYNPYVFKDAFEFFGSLDKYAAICPAKQTGQIPLIGLSSRRFEFGSFAQDTRAMFMLAALNDHTLGSFGRREEMTVARLDSARAQFRQWEKDVTFTGYWESKDLCSISDSKIALSAYTRKGQALLMFGNTGDKDSTFRVQPAFDKLKIDAKTCTFLNAETHEVIPFNGKEFTLNLKKHDIVMVLAGKKDSFQLFPRLDWDKFLGKDKDVKYQKHLPEGENGFGKINGRYYIAGDRGGYGQATTKLPADIREVSLLVSANTCAGLVFGKDKLLYGTRAPGKKMNYYLPNGKRIYGKNQWKDAAVSGWYPHNFYAVKFVLSDDKIRTYISYDAKTWKLDAEIKRTADLAGAPAELLVGWGVKGKYPLLRNLKKNYAPQPRYPHVRFFSNVNWK